VTGYTAAHAVNDSERLIKNDAATRCTDNILFGKMTVICMIFLSYSNSGYTTHDHRFRLSTQQVQCQHAQVLFFAEHVVEPWNSVFKILVA